MSDLEIVRRIANAARGPTASFRFWVGELERRQQAKQTKTVKNLTWWIAGMTIVMILATIVNVYVASDSRVAMCQ